ncbi:MAG: zinc-ribbon domain-containing protein [Candidatus Freyarchaeota archaeon]
MPTEPSTQLPSAVPATKYCPYCGAQLPLGATYCPNCGKQATS